ncbi:hypothetical protein BDN72DRAFT_90904 [Pluteus cervinus]|uniref:Uncharacterized protein n=1 Tax=Pluteus cervinus TaxID=181527 RepID=A0ACD3AQN2_9AGAR|nr:hypothetical protein BDN72DRAFT_90904 [Pluteus cervinus]
MRLWYSIFLVYLFMHDICRAYLWSPKPTHPRGLEAKSVTPSSSHGVPFSQLATLHAYLEKYDSEPDCFRQVAQNIRVHCQELDMHEAERVHAAISMTLCELATTQHHTIPLECAPFSAPRDASIKSEVQGKCVNALSRSTQYWSSYSGYLREVPQLCETFQRWNDIDVAKKLYRNITLDQINFLQSVSLREHEAEAVIKTFDKKIRVTFNSKPP